jgi:hypothetical protein
MHKRGGGGPGGLCVDRSSRHRLMKFQVSIKIYCPCDLCSPKGGFPHSEVLLKAMFSLKKKVFLSFSLFFVEFPAVPSSLCVLIKYVEEVASRQTVYQCVLVQHSLASAACYCCCLCCLLFVRYSRYSQRYW